MLFYKFIGKDDLNLSMFIRDSGSDWFDMTLIPNELLTVEEFDDLKSQVPKIAKYFTKREVDEDDVYEMFGARFEDGSNWNNESVRRNRRIKISETVKVPDNWSKENKAIVKGLENTARELLGDKWNDLSDKQQHDIVMALANDLTKYLDKDSKKESTRISRDRKAKRIKESFDDIHYDFARVTSKDVRDSDGFWTEYTMYEKIEAPTSEWFDWLNSEMALSGDIPEEWITGYGFIFGDSDVYDPENRSYDYECDTEKEAYEWFDNYNGFDDDDDFYESFKKNKKMRESFGDFRDEIVMFVDGKRIDIGYVGIYDAILPEIKKSLAVRDAIIDWLNSGGDEIAFYDDTDNTIADMFDYAISHDIDEQGAENYYEEIISHSYEDHPVRIEIFNKNDVA